MVAWYRATIRRLNELPRSEAKLHITQAIHILTVDRWTHPGWLNWHFEIGCLGEKDSRLAVTCFLFRVGCELLHTLVQISEFGRRLGDHRHPEAFVKPQHPGEQLER